MFREPKLATFVFILAKRDQNTRHISNIFKSKKINWKFPSLKICNQLHFKHTSVEFQWFSNILKMNLPEFDGRGCPHFCPPKNYGPKNKNPYNIYLDTNHSLLKTKSFSSCILGLTWFCTSASDKRLIFIHRDFSVWLCSNFESIFDLEVLSNYIFPDLHQQSLQQ